MDNNKKVKISVEIPSYLKTWIENHDISQNALVVMGLRRLYNEDVKQVSEVFMSNLLNELSSKKLPF
jgi:hypothetical protein